MWEKVFKYPKIGDYVRAEYRGKIYEGKVIGNVTRFRTGYIAIQIENLDGKMEWMPWSSKIDYYVKDGFKNSEFI